MSCISDTSPAATSFYHAHAQVEWTTGTISGKLLGLGISLGDGFGQDSDMVLTGAVLLLLVIWMLRPFAGPFLELSWQLQAASSPASASFNCSSGICPHSCDADVGWSHGALVAPLHVCSLQGRLA